MARVALVAGASSGLGAAVARALAANGYQTYAGARSFAGGKLPPEGCLPIPLDVTQSASVDAAVSSIIKEAGAIDILINCAAFLTLGSCEETSLEEIRAVMETNFFGMVRMTQAVLPVMRAMGRGHIVQFSSLNGLFGIPFQGAYVASKHALEGWNEALSLEVRRFGVQVTMIEPGDCREGSGKYRAQAAIARQEGSPYQKQYALATNRIHYDEAHGLDPKRVAHAVVRTVSKKRAPARVVVARLDQRLAMWLHDLLPNKFFFRILRAYYSTSPHNS